LNPPNRQAGVSGLTVPLNQFIEQTLEPSPRGWLGKAADVAAKLGARWHKGRMVLHPADPTLQTKEVELEVFFHKIVMMRNQLQRARTEAKRASDP